MNNTIKEMNDSQKIEVLNKRLFEMEQKFYKIHSLAFALVEYEHSDKKCNAVSDVGIDIAELIQDIANSGADIVAGNVPIVSDATIKKFEEVA